MEARSGGPYRRWAGNDIGDKGDKGGFSPSGRGKLSCFDIVILTVSIGTLKSTHRTHRCHPQSELISAIPPTRGRPEGADGSTSSLQQSALAQNRNPELKPISGQSYPAKKSDTFFTKSASIDDVASGMEHGLLGHTFVSEAVVPPRARGTQ